MKELVRLVTVLTLVAAGAGLILSLVESATRAPIAEQRRLETLRALQAVLPPADNAVDEDVARTGAAGISSAPSTVAGNKENWPASPLPPSPMTATAVTSLSWSASTRVAR